LWREKHEACHVALIEDEEVIASQVVKDNQSWGYG